MTSVDETIRENEKVENEKRQSKLPFFIEYGWLINLRNPEMTKLGHKTSACESHACGQ